MKKDDGPRRVVSLQGPGEIFEQAWRGRSVLVPEGVARAGDLVILRKRLSSTEKLSGREVQGIYDMGEDRAGKSVPVFVPVLRWDLREGGTDR